MRTFNNGHTTSVSLAVLFLRKAKLGNHQEPG